MRTLTNKERFDIRTMRYFIPSNKYKTRITKQDEVAMADLSSRGIQPVRQTKGLANLIAGKTYRDEQITAYKRDIMQGLFTKIEIIDSYPRDMQSWITNKLVDVPYDVDSETSRMVMAMYHG